MLSKPNSHWTSLDRPIRSATREHTTAVALQAALALLDQRQNSGNRVFEFRDPADDGG